MCPYKKPLLRPLLFVSVFLCKTAIFGYTLCPSNHRSRSPLLIYALIRIKLEAPQLIVSNTPITTNFTFTATPLRKSAHRLSAWDCSENDLARSKLEQLPRILQFAIDIAPSLLTKSSGYRYI
jgi:hypothetical protein